MSEIELQAWEWTATMAQKIVVIRSKVSEHVDITEEDYDILKIWYRQWWMGTHPLFQTKMDGNDEKAVQQGLFEQNVSTTEFGTSIEYKTVNQKTVKR